MIAINLHTRRKTSLSSACFESKERSCSYSGEKPLRANVKLACRKERFLNRTNSFASNFSFVKRYEQNENSLARSESICQTHLRTLRSATKNALIEIPLCGFFVQRKLVGYLEIAGAVCVCDALAAISSNTRCARPLLTWERGIK
jgi:hypothetical protein